VIATSPRFSLFDTAMNARSVKDASAAARLISAAFAGIEFLISMTIGWFERRGPLVAEPEVPESTRTGTSAARCMATACMIAAVVLRSGG
jgi:hypothetical protein